MLRKYRIIFPVFITFFAALPAFAAEKSVKIDVDGNTYRVFIRDDEVKVFNKSAPTAIRMGRSTIRRDQMRKAVKMVTSCELVNDIWIENYRLGKLDCNGDGVADRE